MTDFSANISHRKAALVAGLGLFAMTVFAVVAIYFVFQKLIVPGDASATVKNIRAGEMQFRLGFICLLVVSVLDVVVAWALYIFLEPVSKKLSLLAAWFRLLYAAILDIALFNYANVLQLLSGANYMEEAGTGQLHVDVMLSLKAFDDGWAIGLVFFGIHLAILGYLVIRSGYIPRILGFVLAIAGVAYVIDSVGRFLLPSQNVGLATFLGWGELLFMMWLLYKSLKAPNASPNTDG